MGSTDGEHGTIEREVKLAVGPDFVVPALPSAGTDGTLSVLELRAAYLDTADLRLWARGITLRHRTGEGPAGGVWTMKLPTDGAGVTLDRTELTWTGDARAVPDAAAAIVAGLVRRSPLVTVTELSTRRRRTALTGADGATWAELDDDSVTVRGGPNDGLRFRQLEVELTDGVDAGLDAGLDDVVARLRAAGAEPHDRPKLGLALGVAPPTGTRPTALDGRSSVGEVVRASIADALERLLDHDYRLRAAASDPSSHDVHQARVATRRLRSDLRTFGAVVDPEWLGHTRDELRWLGDVLGRVRDADVLAGHLDADWERSPGDDAGRDELRALLGEERADLAADLAAALASDRSVALLDRLHAAAGRPPLTAGRVDGRRVRPDDRAGKVVPAMVGARWRALRRRVRKAGRHPTDRQLHRIRIGAKQLRYAAEAAVPVIGKPTRRTAAAAEALQTVLGEQHDAVGAEAWFRERALAASPAGVFAAVRLAADQQRRQLEYRGEWRTEWSALARRKRTAWMG